MSALRTRDISPSNGKAFVSTKHREILVIGGAGYLGSCLVAALLASGHRVTILDALLYGDDSIRDLYDMHELTVVEGDFRSADVLRVAARNADAIVHLGALVGDPACALDEALARDVNANATRTVAEVACELKIQRLVFASTCSVYGASDELLTEESVTAPVSVYAQTKLDSEQLLLGMAQNGFAPTILRFGTFYGHSRRPRFDLVVNLLTANALTKGTITVFGGTQWRPFLHVADGAAAIAACLEAPIDVVGGEIFNVGSDEQNHMLGDVAAMIAEIAPEAHVVVQPSDKKEANYRVSFEKIRTRLGFVPARGLFDGLTEIKASLEQNVVGDYAEAKYDNAKTLAAGSFGHSHT